MVTSCDPGWSLWVHCPIPHGDTTKGSAKAGELLPSPTKQHGVFRGISLFTAGPQSWSLPLVSALRRADLGQHHTKGAPSPVQDQPRASPNPLHLLHPPAPARTSPGGGFCAVSRCAKVSGTAHGGNPKLPGFLGPVAGGKNHGRSAGPWPEPQPSRGG